MTARPARRPPVNDGREPLRAIARALARAAAIKEHARRKEAAADRPGDKPLKPET
jgi:hypothetical protein